MWSIDVLSEPEIFYWWDFFDPWSKLVLVVCRWSSEVCQAHVPLCCRDIFPLLWHFTNIWISNLKEAIPDTSALNLFAESNQNLIENQNENHRFSQTHLFMLEKEKSSSFFPRWITREDKHRSCSHISADLSLMGSHLGLVTFSFYFIKREK